MATESNVPHFGGAAGLAGVVPAATGGGPANPARVRAISAGGDHTCGVTSAGTIKCWGYNELGQLGNGSRSSSLVPVDVMGPAFNARSVSVGNHSCALTSTGGAKCWGPNNYRQLGSDPGIVLVPVDVDGLSSGVAAVSAGAFSTCAIRSPGVVRCWGNPDVGNGRSPFPLDMEGTSEVTSVSVGYGHVCAVTAVGGVKCWGENQSGQLGRGSTARSAVPVDVVGLSSGVVSVSAGYDQTCAVTSAGAVKCWGGNEFGQLGNDSTTGSAVPVDVRGLSSGALSVSAGGSYSCAVTFAGAVSCWGRLNQRKFEAPTQTSPVPLAVDSLSSNVTSVSVGSSHTCALTTTSAVKCWGTNESGQLGNGTTVGSAVPVDVLGL